MTNELERQIQLSPYRRGDAPLSRPARRNVFLTTLAGAAGRLLLLFGVAVLMMIMIVPCAFGNSSTTRLAGSTN